MRIANVTYHREPEGWWAESADVPQFSAAGSSLEEVFAAVEGALSEVVGEPVDIRHDLSEVGVASAPSVLLAIVSDWPFKDCTSIADSYVTAITRAPGAAPTAPPSVSAGGGVLVTAP